MATPVFVTVFDEGKKQVWKLDPATLEFLGGEHLDPMKDSITEYRPGVGHYGTIYNNEFYLTESDAWRAWNRDGWPLKFTLQQLREAWKIRSPKEVKTA